MSAEAAAAAAAPSHSPPTDSPRADASAASVGAQTGASSVVPPADDTTSPYSHSAVPDFANPHSHSHSHAHSTASNASLPIDPSPTAAVDRSEGAAATAPTATGAPVPVGTTVQLVAGKSNTTLPTALPAPGGGAGGGIQVVAPSSFLRRPTPARVQQSPMSLTGSEEFGGAGGQQRPGSASGHMPPPSPHPAISHSHSNSLPKMSSQRSTGSPLPYIGSPAAKRVEATKPMTQIDREQIEGLRAIRAFLKVRTSYDVLPLSFRLIVFDTALLVKKSLNILLQNGIVSAPLWDSKNSTFAGLLTTTDYINVIQYYWQNPSRLHEIEQFTLRSLRDIEKAINAPPIETVSIHPEKPLYEACRMMLASRARRIPLVDIDDETKRAMVVSVVTQYRILKFVAVNVKETQKLKKPLKELGSVGTYNNLATATMQTPVMDVIHMLVDKNISSVPILDRDGTVVNVFEAVDVITLIKGGVYDDLDLTVGEALLKRSEDFSGIYTCSVWDRLDTIFDTVRKSRVHRLVIIDEHSRLVGVLTLSDILEYVLFHKEEWEGGVLD